MVVSVEPLVALEDGVAFMLAELAHINGVGEALASNVTRVMATMTASITAAMPATSGSVDCIMGAAVAAALLKLQALFKHEKLGVEIAETNSLGTSGEAAHVGIVFSIKPG